MTDKIPEVSLLSRIEACWNKDSPEYRAASELIERAKEYRKQFGWQGNPWQERAAIKLDYALYAVEHLP